MGPKVQGLSDSFETASRQKPYFRRVRAIKSRPLIPPAHDSLRTSRDRTRGRNHLRCCIAVFEIFSTQLRPRVQKKNRPYSHSESLAKLSLNDDTTPLSHLLTQTSPSNDLQDDTGLRVRVDIYCLPR